MNYFKGIILIAAVVAVLASCSYLPYHLGSSTASVRVTNLELPDVIREGLPYDVSVSFDSDRPPHFQKACFRWVAEQISGYSPSLYCNSTEVNSNQPLGSACGQWSSEGMVQSSPEFCVGVENMRIDMPGRMLVRIQPQDLKTGYNKLEGYFEYLEDGQLIKTNKADTHILVDK